VTFLNDPGSTAQWYLAAGKGGTNARSIWSQYQGRGVVVGILDDGIDRTHPDLAPNYSAVLSWDFQGGDAVPDAGWNQYHGTAVAGLIGAAANSQGLVGVAPSSTLAMYRVSIASISGPNLASAIGYAAERVDVLNNSWAYSAAFADQPDAPEIAPVIAAVEAAATGGRDGLGTVVVFAAGNAVASSRDSTSYHTVQSQRFSVTTAATNEDGRPAALSTPGPAVLVAAPGENIHTTDRTGAAGYSGGDTTTVSGTSFSAAIVSGVAALMLEAAPRLGARDVQQILAATGRQRDPTAASNAGSHWNGGGGSYSLDTGFGAVDAAAAVRLAETWLIGHRPATFANEESAADSAGTLLVRAGQTCSTSFTIDADLTIDSVVLALNLDPVIALQLRLELVSPGGTSCTLLAGGGVAASFTTVPGYWEISAQAFRQEGAAGTWTLRANAPLDGVLEGLSLSVFGSTDLADDRYVYTDSYPTLASAEPRRAVLADLDGGRDVLNAAAMTLGAQIDLLGTRQWLGGAPLDLARAGSIEDAFGGAGDDRIAGTDGANALRAGEGRDELLGRGGDDTLSGGAGDNALDGGAGSDVALLGGRLAEYLFGRLDDVLVVNGPDAMDALRSIEWLAFEDATLTIEDAIAQRGVRAAVAVSEEGRAGFALMDAYSGPVPYLQWQHLGGAVSEVVVAGGGNDFLNLLAGTDAAQGGGGDDVIDGGAGSNFLSGGSGRDVYFLDARANEPTWSTITDWERGEQLSLWGWRPGVSLASWSSDAGAEGYRGVTLQVDKDADGSIDVSVTWSGRAQVDLPGPVEFDGLLWFIG
jgi:Ca2+-binding RTX toxin-like protein